jgi:cytochrome c oxidase accessory protein FixG
MFDPDTLIITYDAARGDPRGQNARRSKKDGARPEGLGDCIDCGLCVQVCPTGIDIRNGLQYECIGCAACIDGCNQVMDKMGYPRGLIRYSTENALRGHWSGDEVWRRMLRPRTVIYAAILGATVIAVAVALVVRVPLKVDVIRDRGALGRIVEDGMVENVYRLQVMNTREQFLRYRISVSGIESAEVVSEAVAEVPSATTKTIPVRVRVAPGKGAPGSNRIEFEVQAINHEAIRVREKAVFLIPR